MKHINPYISDIINLLKKNNYKVEPIGDTSAQVDGFSSLYNYKPGTISWVRNKGSLMNANIAEGTRILCIVTSENFEHLPNATCQLKTTDPKAVFFFILDYFWKEESPNTISEKSVIEKGAIIGKNVSIGSFSYISPNVKIGNDCYIGTNVTIKGKVNIGNHCSIQSGAVIGEDGFQFIEGNNMLQPVPHYGGVTIGNHVQIGSFTCICRGTIDDTIIGDYSKIDNLCHIAHNIVIGKRVRVIAGATIMGSVHIGDDCWVSTSIIRDQRYIGEKSVIGMGAVVVNNVSNNVTVAGVPAKEIIRKEKI